MSKNKQNLSNLNSDEQENTTLDPSTQKKTKREKSLKSDSPLPKPNKFQEFITNHAGVLKELGTIGLIIVAGIAVGLALTLTGIISIPAVPAVVTFIVTAVAVAAIAYGVYKLSQIISNLLCPKNKDTKETAPSSEEIKNSYSGPMSKLESGFNISNKKDSELMQPVISLSQDNAPEDKKPNSYSVPEAEKITLTSSRLI